MRFALLAVIKGAGWAGTALALDARRRHREGRGGRDLGPGTGYLTSSPVTARSKHALDLRGARDEGEDLRVAVPALDRPLTLLAVIQVEMAKPPPVRDIGLDLPNGWWFPAARPQLVSDGGQLAGPPPVPCSASMSARSAARSTLAAAASSLVMITQASS